MGTDQPSHDSLPESLPDPTTKNGTLIAVCHCGAVQLQLPSKPTALTECHCTVCYKYGTLWAYFPRSDVVVTTAGDTKLQAYIRDDESTNGDLSFNRCSHCGCIMCWLGEGKYSGPDHKMGVNCRMLPENQIKDIKKEVIAGP
jgi:hypothetical protein